MEYRVVKKSKAIYNALDVKELLVEQRTQTICLVILTTIAVAAAMYFLAPVMVPLVLAFFFTYCLTPVIDFLTLRLKLPRLVSLLITVLFGGIILLLLGGVVLNTASQISEHAGTYQERFKTMLEGISSSLPLESWGISQNDITESLKNVSEMALKGIFPAIVNAAMGLLSNGALVFIIMLFILLGRNPGEETAGTIRSEVELKVKRYIITKVFISTCTAFFVWLVLFLFKVDFALVFGVLTFMLNFIPSIGSVIATFLPLPVVLISPEHTVTVKFLAILLPGAIQFGLGNVLEPRIMGQTLDLHPITILVALIFFGMLWGIPGMFLATPITAIIKIILEKYKSSHAIAEILAGRLDAVDKTL
jgi:AI-2 transport protein TqsA